MREETVTSLSKFIDIIKELGDEGFSFYRGQDSYMKQKLLPSLLRLDYETGERRIFSNKCDQTFINTFKSKGISHLDILPENDWEWMSTAQHFSLPTRLLDWSQSPLSALFFAVENERYKYKEEIEDSPVVWCLNPNALNEKSRFIEDYNIIPNIIEKNETFHSNLKQKFGVGVTLTEVIPPVALICPSSNNRINAQRGVFTLFPLNAVPLEESEFADEILFKLKIDRNLKEGIKKQLFSIGVSYSSIYPELEYISKDIKSEYLMNS